MPETDKKAPRVINKSGTLKMEDRVAERKVTRDISGRRMERRNRRDRVRAEAGPKEFDDITIAVDRVSRTVAGGRRMRFKALVAIGNHKNKVGIGVAKGNDVTTAVAKATSKAKKSMITFAVDGETICHETRTKVTGADVLMKPAAPGTGIIAGGTVRAIMGLTGVKNLISKSLGSTNKVNIAYAVIEGLREQVPRSQWTGAKPVKGELETADGSAKGTDGADTNSADSSVTSDSLAGSSATKASAKKATAKTTKKTTSSASAKVAEKKAAEKVADKKTTDKEIADEKTADKKATTKKTTAAAKKASEKESK